jgi:type IV pilus assembly protein PilP
MIRAGFVLATAFAALLAGCGGGDRSDLERYVAEVKARKSSNIQPIPEIQPYQPYSYRPADRREPFTPTLLGAASGEQGDGSGVQPDRDRPREPLEKYPLDSLRMKGTLSAGGILYALIQDSEGIVYRVTRGDHMGQNYGEIIGITPSEVNLIEVVPDGLGGYMERSANIALSEE